MNAATVWVFDIGYWRWTPHKTYTTSYKGRSPMLRARLLRKRLLSQGHSSGGVRAVEGNGEGYLPDEGAALNGGPYPECWSTVPNWWGDDAGEANVPMGESWSDARREQMGRLYTKANAA